MMILHERRSCMVSRLPDTFHVAFLETTYCSFDPTQKPRELSRGSHSLTGLVRRDDESVHAALDVERVLSTLD
jgi:hypothetical protein